MRRVLMAMFVALIVFSSGCKKAEKNVVITVNDTPIMQKEVDAAVEKQMNSPFLAQFDKKSDRCRRDLQRHLDKGDRPASEVPR